SWPPFLFAVGAMGRHVGAGLLDRSQPVRATFRQTPLWRQDAHPATSCAGPALRGLQGSLAVTPASAVGAVWISQLARSGSRVSVGRIPGRFMPAHCLRLRRSPVDGWAT